MGFEFGGRSGPPGITSWIEQAGNRPESLDARKTAWLLKGLKKMGHKALVIDPLDNVATVLVDVSAEEEVVCDQGSVVDRCCVDHGTVTNDHLCP